MRERDAKATVMMWVAGGVVRRARQGEEDVGRRIVEYVGVVWRAERSR